MTPRSSFVFLLALAGLLGTSLLARADRNPDFEDDAKPVLNMQPGLVQYVEQHFEVKDHGTAKFPGTDDRRPMPPFIFKAKARGEPGPFHLRLLIQPGPPGRILNIVDMNRVDLPPGATPPSHASAPPPVNGQQHAPSTPTLEPAQQVPSKPAPTATTHSAAPTSDTPSGPITSDTPSGPVSSGNNLAPPPDPAPAQ